MEKSALIYITLTIITVMLGLCVKNQDYVGMHVSGRYLPGRNREQARNLVAEWAIYCLLAGVSACRIAVGNDYWVYRRNFQLIAQNRHVSSEPGFNTVVRWMQALFGEEQYLPVFGLFSLVTVFFFVKALHDQGSCFAFSLFLLLTGGYYFNSLNSVRYYLALALALYAMKYVLRREYVKFLLWILAGAMFHKSIIVVIPIYITARLLAAAGWKRWHYMAGGALMLSLIFGQEVYRRIIFYFYPFYENSAFDNGRLSYVNILKCVCVLTLCLICRRNSLRDVTQESQVRLRFYFFLNAAGLVVYCCGSFIPEVSRIGYYLIISQIFLIPELLRGMKQGIFRKLCYMGVAGAFSLYFVVLLRQMYEVDVRLLPYLNWIFN